MNVVERTASVLSEVLEIPVSPDQNLYRSDTVNWDSLKHLELIFSLEEEFQVRFTAEQATGITNLHDIVKIIEQTR